MVATPGTGLGYSHGDFAQGPYLMICTPGENIQL